MSQLIQEIKLSDAGYSANLKKATEALVELNEQNGVTDKSIANVAKEMRSAQKYATQLAISYNQLSKEAKASDFGQTMAKEMEAAIQKAAELADVQADVKREINSLASDTRGIDTIKEGFDVLASTVQMAAGVMGAFGADEKEVAQMISVTQGALGALNAATAIQTALQKESNIMQTISNIQRKASLKAIAAETAAKHGSTTATIAATAAQKVFNTVAMANPYVLLATAIVGVGAALYGLTKYFSDSNEEAEKLKKRLEEDKKAAQEFKQSFNQKYADGFVGEQTKLEQLSRILHDTNASLKQRQSALKQIQSTVKDYHASLTNEGKLYNDNVTAIDKYINNLQRAAKAQAAYQKMVELKKDNLDLDYSMSGVTRKRYGYAGADGRLAYTIDEYNDMAHRRRINDKRIKELERMIGNDAISLGSNSNNKTKSTTENPYQKLQIKLAQIQQKYANGLLTQVQQNEEIRNAYQEYYNALSSNTKSLKQNKSKLDNVSEIIKKYGDNIKQLKLIEQDQNTVKDANENYKKSLEQIQRDRLNGWDTEDNLVKREISAREDFIKNIQKVNDLTPELIQTINKKQKEIKGINTQSEKGQLYKTIYDVSDVAASIIFSEFGRDYSQPNEYYNETKGVILDFISAIKSQNLKRETVVTPYSNRAEYSVDNQTETVVKSLLNQFANKFGYLDNSAIPALYDVIESLKDYQNGVDYGDEEAIAKALKRFIDGLNDFMNQPIAQEGGLRFYYPTIKNSGKNDERYYRGNWSLPNLPPADVVIPDFEQPKSSIEMYMSYLEDLKRDYAELERAAVSMKRLIDLGETSPDASAMYNNLYKELEEQLYEIADISEIVQDKLNFKYRLEGIDEIASATDNILGFADSWVKLGDSLDNCKNGWEQFLTIFAMVMNTFKEAESIMGTINTLNELFGAVVKKNAITTGTEALANQSNNAAKAQAAAAAPANIAAMTGEAVAAKTLEGALLELAAAQIFAAHAAIPFAGVGIAAGQSTAMLTAMAGFEATIKGLQAFATGGIVSTGSFTGDNTLVRVNKGEMILNGGQQSNLFNLLNGNASAMGIGGGEVEFHIRGNDLYGVLNNYGKKLNKLGR